MTTMPQTVPDGALVSYRHSFLPDDNGTCVSAVYLVTEGAWRTCGAVFDSPLHVAQPDMARRIIREIRNEVELTARVPAAVEYDERTRVIEAREVFAILDGIKRRYAGDRE